MNDNVKIGIEIEISAQTHEHIKGTPEVTDKMRKAAEEVLYEAVLKDLQ